MALSMLERRLNAAYVSCGLACDIDVSRLVLYSASSHYTVKTLYF